MRKLFTAFLCLTLVFVAGFAGYRGYKIWKQKRLVKMARTFIAKSDAPNALLCLRQALQSNPHNLEACQLMASFAEAARSPQAVIWRSRLVELQPDSLPDRLALARTALAAGDAVTARKALAGVKESHQKTAVYQLMAGAVDLSAQRFSEAEQHISEAARIEPTNATCQLDLATLRLRKKDPLARAQARATMNTLAANPTVRCEALRQLTIDALRNTNTAAALVFSDDLLRETNSVFTDRMLHLDILRAAMNTGQRTFLARLQLESAGNPAKAYEVAKWMLAATQAGTTLAWIKTLPGATRTNLPVPLAEADCYMALKDWTGLLTNSASQIWGDLDCLRLTCRARAYKEQGQVGSAKAEWLAAMKAAQTRRELLVQLYNTTSGWRWAPEREDVLWAIVNRYPNEQWAVQALTTWLFDEKRTRSLLTLFGQTVQNDSTNMAALNNLAVTALLLEAWEKKPHELAQAAYAKSPTNASFASTYAYSLLVQKKPEAALRTIERLKPEQLAEPSIAAYYGIILTASGHGDKAKNYLDLASKAKLLPEEEKLVEKARRKS
jgi:tetratricopeptide (TPR) repeat protein